MVDQIREAFSKVKEEILDLKTQIRSITENLLEIKRTILDNHRQTNRQTRISLDSTQNQTHSTDTEEVKEDHTVGTSQDQNFSISTGNDGVQTDRPTDQQTNTSIRKFVLIQEKQSRLTRVEKVAEILSSLDALKKELRTQFKRLTTQEMLVFSTIYQLTDEGISVDYSLLAKKINLSESSIRDYIQKIVKKGVPLLKEKENNKRVILSIPQAFKKIASLSTIISLRDL